MTECLNDWHPFFRGSRFNFLFLWYGLHISIAMKSPARLVCHLAQTCVKKEEYINVLMCYYKHTIVSPRL